MRIQLPRKARSLVSVHQSAIQMMIAYLGRSVMISIWIIGSAQLIIAAVVGQLFKRRPLTFRGEGYAAQMELRAGTSLQAHLDEIVRDIIEVFGYTGALIATYEQGDSLAMRACYVDPTIATPADMAGWQAQMLRMHVADCSSQSTHSEKAQVWTFDTHTQASLRVQAARVGQSIGIDQLSDLFRPIVSASSDPLSAASQPKVKQYVIAVPVFLKVAVTGGVQKERVGTLFALKASQIDANDSMVLSVCGRQVAAAMLSERRRLEVEVAQKLTYQLQTHLQDENQMLNRIAEGVVHDLGYVGCGVATYEIDGLLPLRALYLDPTIASPKQMHAWETELTTFFPPEQPFRMSDSEIVRVFVNDPAYADNLSVDAAKTGQPAVSNSLYKLLHPIVPASAKELVDYIQQSLGVQHVIAVPFFMEVLVEGVRTRKLMGNLFAITRSKRFSSGEIALLQAFGQQAAVSIRNTRLYQQAEDQRLAAQIFGKMAFTAAASVHALRNYVGVIRGNFQLLTILEQFPQDERNDLLKEMRMPIFEQLERITDTLDTLHEPWQQTQEEPAEFNFCVLRAIRKANGEVLGLNLDLADDLPAIIASSDMLVEALSVLIEHAMHASEACGVERRIDVTSVLHEDNILLTITDNGQVLPHNIGSTIFEMRPQSAKTGSDFSLYWTKEYIEGMGGQIDVMSLPGVGTTFKASFPLVKAERPSYARHDSNTDQAAR